MHLGLYPTSIKRLQNYLLTPEKCMANSTGIFIVNRWNIQYMKMKKLQRKKNILYFHYEFKYHSTVLFDCQCVALNSGVYKMPVPKFGTINVNAYQDGILYYRYFIENTMLYNTPVFMYKGDSMEEKFAMRKFLECVLVYKNDEEKGLFGKHILNNLDKVNQSINENNSRVFGITHLSSLARVDITKK